MQTSNTSNMQNTNLQNKFVNQNKFKQLTLTKNDILTKGISNLIDRKYNSRTAKTPKLKLQTDKSSSIETIPNAYNLEEFNIYSDQDTRKMKKRIKSSIDSYQANQERDQKGPKLVHLDDRKKDEFNDVISKFRSSHTTHFRSNSKTNWTSFQTTPKDFNDSSIKDSTVANISLIEKQHQSRHSKSACCLRRDRPIQSAKYPDMKMFPAQDKLNLKFKRAFSSRPKTEQGRVKCRGQLGAVLEQNDVDQDQPEEDANGRKEKVPSSIRAYLMRYSRSVVDIAGVQKTGSVKMGNDMFNTTQSKGFNNKIKMSIEMDISKYNRSKKFSF